jgi:hypothetical protein
MPTQILIIKKYQLKLKNKNKNKNLIIKLTNLIWVGSEFDVRNFLFII